MTWVKICGTTNLEDALVSVEAGADAVGFVFYEKSPRTVSVETACAITAELPSHVEKVGVFVDADCGEMIDCARNVGLTALQLHGERSLTSVLQDSGRAVEAAGISKLIPVIAADKLGDGGIFLSEQLRTRSFAVLIDTQTNGLGGGTGVPFDWKEAQAMVEAMSTVLPVIVAGGLTSLNVSVAMKTFQPFGVDVVSGVEVKPGKKDPEKVRAFVKAVRDFDRKTS